MFKFTDLPKKTQNKILADSDYDLSFVSLNTKSTLQGNQKVIDTSTSANLQETTTFGSATDVMNSKIEIIINRPSVKTKTIFNFNNENPKITSFRTRSNKINIDSKIWANNTIYIIVSNDNLFEEKLIADKISYKKYEGIVISIGRIITLGIEKVLSMITVPINTLFNSELGELCIITDNPEKNQEIVNNIIKAN